MALIGSELSKDTVRLLVFHTCLLGGASFNSRPHLIISFMARVPSLEGRHLRKHVTSWLSSHPEQQFCYQCVSKIECDRVCHIVAQTTFDIDSNALRY
jgi:hypothetical protein